MSALNVLCAQLTRDLFAIAKFLFDHVVKFDDFSLRYGDISIFKMAAVRHLEIVLLPYETNHEVSVAGRTPCQISCQYTDLKI